MNKQKVLMGVMVLLFLFSLFFAIEGLKMHKQVAIEEDRFHSLQAKYFDTVKSERDSAASGSELSNQLVEIQQYPSELLRLKLEGVEKILTGIYILLFGILIALMMIPVRLGMIINGKKKK
ncbi:MAG: hypothetical protein ACI9P9_000063 [Patescibacteria group bacterium]|jgi:hypothetical protein